MSVDSPPTAPDAPAVAAGTANGPVGGGQLLRASLIVAVGDVAGRAVSFATGVVLARWALSQEEFGDWGFLQTTVGMFGLLAGFGLGMAVSRYVALYRTADPPRARAVARFVFLFGLLTNVAAAALITVTGPRLVSEHA